MACDTARRGARCNPPEKTGCLDVVVVDSAAFLASQVASAQTAAGQAACVAGLPVFCPPQAVHPEIAAASTFARLSITVQYSSGR